MTDITPTVDPVQPDGDLWRGPRPRPRFADLLAAAGGAAAIGGVIVALTAVGEGDGTLVTSALLLALLAAAAYVAIPLLDETTSWALVAVALVAGALPTPLLLATKEDIDFVGAATGTFVVATAVWLAFFVLPPGRGRPAFLAASLVGAWLVLSIQVGSNSSTGFSSGEESDNPLNALNPLLYFFGGAFSSRGLSVVSFLFGVGYLAAGYALDRRSATSSATAFVAVGDVALVVSMFLMAGSIDGAGQPIIQLAVGGALCWFGAALNRRGTAWLGAALLFGGLVGLAASISDDEGPGGMLLALGGVLTVVAARVLAQRPVAAAVPGPGASGTPANDDEVMH